MMIKGKTDDHRMQVRLANPHLDVTSNEYEECVKVVVNADNSILFLKFHNDFLNSKLEEVESESFPGLFEAKETAYAVKMKLLGKNVKLLTRSMPSSSIKKSKKDKNIFGPAFHELLTKGKYDSAKYHNKTVPILCSITKVRVNGNVSISGLRDIGKSTGTNLPIEDLLEWRIGVDKMQCDMFVDTETVAAIFKLASFDQDKDLFSAPLENLKPRKKCPVKK